MTSLLAFARSRAGRAILAGLGVALIVVLIRYSGAESVADSMARALPYLAVVVALEGLIVIADTITLSLLYRAPRPPLPVILRATLIGYTWAALAPAGRTVAEGLKAGMLAPYSTGARAGVAAGRIQATVVLSAALLSAASLLPAFALPDTRAARWAIGANTLLTLILGLALMTAGQRLNLGALLGRVWRRAESLGPEMDALWRAEPIIPWAALLAQMAGRACTVLQIWALLAALGDVDGPRALFATGLFLVGASVGGFIPAQLGANEANFVLCAPLLGLSSGDAIAVPMLIRAAQFFWAAVGLAVPLVWPRVETA